MPSPSLLHAVNTAGAESAGTRPGHVPRDEPVGGPTSASPARPPEPRRCRAAPNRFGRVTALPPGGDSFSSCRCSPTRAQPGPGVDVPGPVHVGVVRAAVGTDHRVLPRALASLPAGVAGDARPGRVHQDHPPAGAFSLAGEDAGELR